MFSTVHPEVLSITVMSFEKEEFLDGLALDTNKLYRNATLYTVFSVNPESVLDS